MSSGRKPVIVRKFSRDWCVGYAAANPAAESTELELLDNTGKLIRIGWETVKWVCYVREPVQGAGLAGTSSADGSGPERLLRKRFASRPRSKGLWLRLTLKDGDELEGVAANDRSLLDGAGVMLTPPDTRTNTQRVFVPREAIREFTVLGVLGTAGPHRQARGIQPELFPEEPED